MKVSQADSFFYRIQSKVTENVVCANLNTSKQNILRNNNNLQFYEGEWVKITTNDYITHIVKPIETLVKIANKYNLTVDKIMSDNQLKTDKLFIGQTLKIKADK